MEKLFRIAGFTPFILIIFLNAFVDLGHKILIQNTVFKVYDGQTQIILTAIVNGLILLPFVLLFTPAGMLSDRYRKPRIMRYSAAVAVGLTLLITASYYAGWFWFSFAMTFLLAVQSAIYSPAKYGFIKELAGKDQLASANGVVQAVTIVAILLGIFVFSVFFERGLAGIDYAGKAQLLQAIAPIGWLLVVCSAWEFWLTWRLPAGEAGIAERGFDWGRYGRGRYLRDNLGKILANRTIWLSIVGLSVFWGISQVVLAAFPAFAKETLGETNTVVIQGLLACSGIGIIIGSLLAGKASKSYIETGLVPLGALGVVVTLFFVPQLSSSVSLALAFILLGVAGGLFIVPLNALIQFHAKDQELGTILAGNNWVQNVVMLGFLGLTVAVRLQRHQQPRAVPSADRHRAGGCRVHGVAVATVAGALCDRTPGFEPIPHRGAGLREPAGSGRGADAGQPRELAGLGGDPDRLPAPNPLRDVPRDLRSLVPALVPRLLRRCPDRRPTEQGGAAKGQRAAQGR